MAENTVHVFIRHGKKKHNNRYGVVDGLDPELTYTDIDVATELVQELQAKYGKPTAVFCSPYRRTRQTATWLLELLSEHENIIPNCHTALSEFFGTSRSIETKGIHITTLEYGVVIESGEIREKLMALDRRTRKYLEQLPSEPGVYWHISHGTVINSVAHNLTKKRLPRLDTLGYFVYHPSTTPIV